MENLEIKKILEKVFKRSIDVDTIESRRVFDDTKFTYKKGLAVSFKFEDTDDEEDDEEVIIYTSLEDANEDGINNIEFTLVCYPPYEEEKEIKKCLHKYTDNSWINIEGIRKWYKEGVDEWVDGFDHDEIVKEMKAKNIIDEDDIESEDYNFEEKVKEYREMLYDKFNMYHLNEIWEEIGGYGENEDVYVEVWKSDVNYHKLAEIMIEEEDDSFLIDALDMSEEDEVEYNGKTYFVFCK